MYRTVCKPDLFLEGSIRVPLKFFPVKCHYSGKHLQTKMSKRSKQVKITLLLGPGPSKRSSYEVTFPDILPKSVFLKKKKVYRLSPFCDRCLSLVLNFLQNPTQAAKLKRAFNGQKVTNKLSLTFTFTFDKAKKKYMCVYCHMSKQSRAGRSALIFFFFFFLLSAKPEIVVPESDSGSSISRFPVSRHLF